MGHFGLLAKDGQLEMTLSTNIQPQEKKSGIINKISQTRKRGDMADGQIILNLVKIPTQERMEKVMGSCSELRH